jgi:hypothetical protein
MTCLGFLKKTDDNNTNRDTNREIAEMGRVTNTIKLPVEIRRDWRRAFSSMGPRIKAMIRGAGSYPNFLKRYPIIPKRIITTTSKVL